MYILLTDILSCPRCGPDFGLIVLAERIEARRVLEGALGCANCRERYPIRGGVADLRSAEAEAGAAAGASAQEPPAPETAAEEGPEAAVRWLALLGVTEGPANILVTGPATRVAPLMARRVEHLEVVAAGARAEQAEAEPGVTRIAVAGRLPFHDRSLRGVVLTGASADALLEEGVRCTAVLGRLVLSPAPADAGPRLAAAGMRVLASADGTIVASRG
jgi:uncharacterized protein YbaR (Trm112 family)